MTKACDTFGWVMMKASISAGATMKWLMRSTSRSRPLKMVRPSASRTPRSPLLNHPSAEKAWAVSSGFL
jgi:hypothetical protein